MATQVADRKTARLASARRHSHRLAHLMNYIGDVLRIAETTLAPLLDLVIRLWLAQIFWASGLVKLMNWQTALTLAEHEYPVSWLNPVAAAYTGATIELICPVLLALGLATRLAAIPMLILSLVIYFEYLPLNQHIAWAILFGWYVIMGAGPLSLDRLISRGLADAALPLTSTVNTLYEKVTQAIGPIYKLFVRCCLAYILFRAVAILPFPWLLSHTLPILLLVGFATRLSSLIILILLLLFFVAPSAAQNADVPYWYMLLGLIILTGPGQLSVDHWLLQSLRKRFPQLQGLPPADLADLPHVVIIGAGFGGVTTAQALRHAACRITLIDRHNYHLFQPLLYQVATAGLSPADIATPIRSLFRNQHNIRVLLGQVTDVDTEQQCVIMQEKQISYDYLVLATGARHSYFGRDDWEPYAPGLKQIEDATAVRRRLLIAFEQAENSDDPAEQQRLLTFVIVGGGPTGVELAGAIAELARHGMGGEFQHIDPATARVLLIQSAPRLLPAFPEALSIKAAEALSHLGVEIMTKSRVQEIDAEGVIVGEHKIPAGTTFWAAGVIASPAAAWLNAEADRAGRVKVDSHLAVPGHDNIFAIGDTVLAEVWDGQAMPGLAPAAKQSGAYIAKRITADLEGRKPPRPFRYQHLGSLATIGRKAAVIDFGWIRLQGALAWWLWGAAHILFLAGMRNRISVALEWFWAYLTFRRSTRLITGTDSFSSNNKPSEHSH